MALSYIYVIKLIRKLIRCVILVKIKWLLFDGTFYLGLLKILLQNVFFIWKSSVTDQLFVSFFEVKSQNESVAIKNIQDFNNAAKSLISHQMHEKLDKKVTARYIFQSKC